MVGKILRKILSFFAINRGPQPAPSFSQPQVNPLISSGNLVVGKNTDITNLSITILGQKPGKLNIEIGDDCIIAGNITLYNPEAKITIGDRVFIGHNSVLFSYVGITIESDVMISWGCTLIDTNSHSLVSKERLSDVTDWKKGWEYKNWDVVDSKPIRICAQAWIGFNSIINKGITVSNGAIVASGSVVTKNVDPFTIVGGNPASFIKSTT